MEMSIKKITLDLEKLKYVFVIYIYNGIIKLFQEMKAVNHEQYIGTITFSDTHSRLSVTRI